MVLKFNINLTAGDGTVHSLVTNGQSIGNKFIADLTEPTVVTAVDLIITDAFDTPTISDFSVYQCLLL